MEQKEWRFYLREPNFIADFMENLSTDEHTTIIKSLVFQNIILFSKRARRYKFLYYLTKYISFVAPLVISAISALGLADANPIVLLLSLAASISIGVAGIGKFRENWIRYRRYCEQLKLEIMRYASDSGVYDAKRSIDNKIDLLADRIEKLFSSENTEWVEMISKDDNTSAKKA